MTLMTNTASIVTIFHETITVSGPLALELARRTGVPLSSYNDPTADGRDNLTLSEATNIAAADPGLLYYEAEVEAIQQLNQEAGQAGDSEQCRLCRQALEGDFDAFAECVSVMQDAKARVAS